MTSTTNAARGETVCQDLTRLVMDNLREIPDFPEPGVLFRDITPLLSNGEAFADLVQGLASHYRGRIDAVAGLESRGFILAAPLAVALGIACRCCGLFDYECYHWLFAWNF